MNIYAFSCVHDDEINTFIVSDTLELTSDTWKKIVEFSDIRPANKAIAQYEHINSWNGYVNAGDYVTFRSANTDITDYFSVENRTGLSTWSGGNKYVKLVVVDKDLNVLEEYKYFKDCPDKYKKLLSDKTR